MSDDGKPDDLRAKAAFAIAKSAAEHALEEGLADKRKRNKRIAMAVVGLLVVVGLIGLMLHYWYWALLLGLVGAAGLYGRHRWRASRASRALRKKPEEVAARELPAKKVRIEPAPAPPAANVNEDEDEIDDELAELKARLKR